MSKNWYTWQGLLGLWGKEEFELFDLLKQGLQAYSWHGKKVVDSDSLKRAPRSSLEEIERNLRAKLPAKVLGASSAPAPSEWEIKQRAKLIYESQVPEIVNPPKDCILMSFSLPLNENEATKVLEEARGFKFKLKDVLEVAKKNGLRLPDQEISEGGIQLGDKMFELSKWITGKQLRLPKHLRGFEFFEDYVKKGLQPHDELGQPIAPPDVSLEISMLKGRIRDTERDLRSLRSSIDPAEIGRRRMISANKLPGSRSGSSTHYRPPSPNEVSGIKRGILQEEGALKNLKEKLSSIADFSWAGYSLPKSRPNATKMLDLLDNALYKKQEVEKLGLLLERSGKPEHEKDITVVIAKKEKKLRPSQKHRLACREIARRLWQENPAMTIADMSKEEKIINVSTRKDGELYTEKTVRNWIKDLCPNRLPGRRAKQQ